MSTEAKETPTPETDTKTLLCPGEWDPYVESDFARTLERRLNAALAENAKLRDEFRDRGVLAARDAAQRIVSWQRVAGELYKVLTDSGTQCEQLHHGKKDQHGSHIACPVEARIKAAQEAFRALSEPTQPSASPPTGS